MKKFWNYKLWWRVPIGLFSLIGVLSVICIIYGNTQRLRTRLASFNQQLSPVVKIQRRGNNWRIVNVQTRKTIVKHLDGWENIEYPDSMLLFETNHKYGFVNINTGTIDIEPQYDHAWAFSEGLAAVMNDNQVGFIRPNGTMALPMKFIFELERELKCNFQHGFCYLADSTFQYGIIDTLGNWFIEPLYDRITFGDNYFIAFKKGSLSKQIAFDGHIINEQVVDAIYKISYNINAYDEIAGCEVEHTVVNPNFFKYAMYDRYGLMNKKGEIITPPIYTGIDGLGPKLFRAILQDNYSEVLIDDKGNVVSDLAKK